jgi:hypothetical protein
MIFSRWPFALIAVLTLGCGESTSGTEDPMAQGCPESGARVFFTAQGDVTLNGRRMDVSELQNALLALSPMPTVICYSRESPDAEPHPAVQTVIEAMMATQLPVGFYTDATFRTPVVPE